MSERSAGIVAMLVLFSLLASFGAQSQTKQNYWHTSDYYSIELNGVGNAFVSVEMNLQSLSETPVQAITLKIPYSDAVIYRVLSSNYSTIYPYYRGSYPYYNQNLQFANYTTIRGANYTLLTIFLKQPLVNNSQTTLYLFFSTRETAQKTFQGHQFAVNTIVDENALIQQEYAGVAVPQDMYLKGEPAFNINYQSELLPSTLSGAASPAQIATYLPAIFPSTSYQYQASNLLPGEDFTISGLFGNNVFLLYLPEIVAGIVVIAVIAFLIKRSQLLSKLKLNFSLKAKKGFSFTRSLLVGATSGFTFEIAYYAIQAAYALIGYGFYNTPFPILMALLSLVILAIALFGLPYYLYANFSKKEGVVAGIAALVAALVYSAIIAILFYRPIVYLMMG